MNSQNTSFPHKNHEIQTEKGISHVEIQKLMRSELEKVALNQKDVLTVDECVIFTGMSKSYLYRLTQQQLIPFYKPHGKKIYFSRDEITQWLLSNHSSFNQNNEISQ